MANHKSSVKRHRQNLKRHARNQGVKSRIRTLAKKVREAIESKDAGAAAAHLTVVGKALDKAVSRGVLHRNNASRRLSRLAHQVHHLSA